MFASIIDTTFQTVVSYDQGATWTPIGTSRFRDSPIRILSAASSKVLFASYLDSIDQLVRSIDGGTQWTSVVLDGDVQGLVRVESDRYVVGLRESGHGGAGAWLVGADPASPTATNLTADVSVEALALTTTGDVLAGTIRKGVYISRDAGETFVSFNEGLPNARILHLDPGHNPAVAYASTTAGLFVYGQAGAPWQQVALDPARYIPSSIISSGSSHLAALVHTQLPFEPEFLHQKEHMGVLISGDAGMHWREVELPAVENVFDILVLEAGKLVLITNKGLYVSQEPLINVSLDR